MIRLVKRLLVVAVLAVPPVLKAYSIFACRGLGQYQPAWEYLSVQPREMTNFSANFLLEYNYTTEDERFNDAFTIRPNRLNFFFKLPWKFGLTAQISERYNMDFYSKSDSVTSGEYTLIRKVKSTGGIEGFRVGLDRSFFDIVYLGAGYERYFGGVLERWDSEVFTLTETGDSILTDFYERTVDSLLYHFRGNGFWGVAGADLGPVQLRGFYGICLPLTVTTEVATTRDTSVVDSTSYTPPAEFGGIARYSARKFGVELSYIQLTGDDTDLSLVPGRIVELNTLWKLDDFDLTAGAGYNQWGVQTVAGEGISDINLSVGARIPIEEFGFGTIGLTGGLRKGGDISEFHIEFKAGVQFQELWKRRERMWGG